jgi:hypothetical protein
MFFKDSKPWTRKQNTWFGVYCTVCVTIVAAVIAYEIWMQTGIFKLADMRVKWISVLSLPCSPELFWGHLVIYKSLTDEFERYGFVCRDWHAGHWILANPQTGRIDHLSAHPVN